MKKPAPKLGFKRYIRLYKYTDSASGDLARDILYDDYFPFLASFEEQKEYLSEQGLWELALFDELVSDYLDYKNSGRVPVVEKTYLHRFREIEYKGKQCLETDETETIRCLQVPGQLYQSTAPEIIKIPASGSLQIYKDVLEVYAHYFRREFQYDFVGFSAQEMAIRYDYSTRKHIRNDFVGWLFTPLNRYRNSIGMVKAVGGCCFRYREWKDAPPGWTLCWIWLHPFHRGRGILTKHWELFKKEFGEDFYVEPPFSEAIKAFLLKAGYKYL